MKSTILLAITLFLISAPAPDSKDIAEITSNFIVPEEVPGLMAAEEIARDSSPESESWKVEVASGGESPDGAGSAQTDHSEDLNQPAKD